MTQKEYDDFVSAVSIPQAVGTIAIGISDVIRSYRIPCFNTASGRYYCNSAVVTLPMYDFYSMFQYRKR